MLPAIPVEGKSNSAFPTPRTFLDHARYYIEQMAWAPMLVHGLHHVFFDEAADVVRVAVTEEQARSGSPVCGCRRDFCYGKSAGKHPVNRGWETLAGPPSFDAFRSAVEDYTNRSYAGRTWEPVRPNVALHLGASSLVVIDIDPRNGGTEGWATLLAALGELPHTITDLTGGGGQHIYFRAPSPNVLPDLATIQLAPGVELLQGRHYLIVPPSLHPSGGYYRWDNAPWAAPLADVPAALLTYVASRAEQQEKQEAEERRLVEKARRASILSGYASFATGDRVRDRARAYLSRIPGAVSGQNGSKHTSAVACKLAHGFGLSIDDAMPLLQEWNATCSPPWSDEDLRRKLEWADQQGGARGSMLVDRLRPDRHQDEPLPTLPDEVLLVDSDGREAVVRFARPEEIRRPAGTQAPPIVPPQPPQPAVTPPRGPSLTPEVEAALQHLAEAYPDARPIESGVAGQVRRSRADRERYPCADSRRIALRCRANNQPLIQEVRCERVTCPGCRGWLIERELANANWRFRTATALYITGITDQQWGTFRRRLRRAGAEYHRTRDHSINGWSVIYNVDLGNSTPITAEDALATLATLLHDWEEGRRPVSTSHGWRLARDESKGEYERLGVVNPLMTTQDIREAAADVGATVRSSRPKGGGRTLRVHLFDKPDPWTDDDLSRLRLHLFAGEVFPDLLPDFSISDIADDIEHHMLN